MVLCPNRVHAWAPMKIICSHVVRFPKKSYLCDEFAVFRLNLSSAARRYRCGKFVERKVKTYG